MDSALIKFNGTWAIKPNQIKPNYRGVRLYPQRLFWYDSKKSDGEVSVMLELNGKQSTPLLPSLPGPHLPGMVAPDRALFMGQIELNCVITLNWIVWNWNEKNFLLMLNSICF